MYTWKKRLLAAILAGCMSIGLMTPALAVEGEGTDPTTTPEVTTSVAPTDEVDPSFSVDPTAEPTAEPTEEPAETPTTEPTETPAETPSTEPTETPAETPTTEPTETPAETPTTEPTESPEITDIPEETIPGGGDPGFTMPDYANMSVEELYAAVKDMSAEDRAIVYSLLTEEQIAALEAYEEQIAYPAIAPQTVSGEDGVSVTVSAPVGAFPAGTTVSIEPVTAPNPLLRALSLEEDKKAVVEDAVAEAFAEEPAEPQQTVAFDITFWLDGQEIQPRDGYTVSVSFEVPNDSALLNGANQLQVFHLEESEDAETVAQPVGEPVEIDTAADTQEIAVEAESFSIYAVSSINGTRGEKIQNGGTVSYTLGDGIEIGDKLYYYSNNAGDKNNTHQPSWTSSNTNVATVIATDTDDYKQHAMVTIQGSGETTITHTYYEYHSGVMGFGSWWETHTEFFNLVINPEVIPEGPLTIDDQITSNGCLVPVLNVDNKAADSEVTYTWYRGENTSTGEAPAFNSCSEVTGDGLEPSYAAENGVNVAVDQGGTYWYYVTATYTTTDGEQVTLTSEPYWVPYSNRLENGDFEQPVVSKWGYKSYWWNSDKSNVQFRQDDPDFILTPVNVALGNALWWKTTAPAKNNQPNNGDIEIIQAGTDKTSQNYGTDSAYSGNQFAELNCQNQGALYQDVLTAPGSELNWSVASHARENNESMAVVIAPASLVADITTQEQLISFINSTTDERVQITTITNGNYWKVTTGSYEVTDNTQYLTRFFFVSKTGSSQGNLLDGVNFSDDISYTIEYYVNGNLQSASTETGYAKPYTLVSASKTAQYRNYALSEVKRGEVVYGGGTSMRLDPTLSNVLKLYYVTTGISVVKTVSGLENDVSLSNYTATFALYEGSFATGDPVATATVTLNGTDRSNSVLFTTSNGGTFKPMENETYTIVETTHGTVEGYTYYGTTIEGTSGTTYTFRLNGYAATLEAVNTYKELPKSADLTIEKQVAGGGKPDQSFIFEITGVDFEMTVVMNPDDFDTSGNCKVTIKDLPAGTYTVTELQNWSWKYSAANATCNVTIDGEVKTASFTNTKDDTPWLGGSDSVENVFATTSGASAAALRDANPAALPKPLPSTPKDDENGDDKNKDQNTEPDPSEPMETQEGGVSNV